MDAEITNTRFGRSEKLKSRKQIQKLFTAGRSIFIHPIKLVWAVPTDSPLPGEAAKILAGVSVSKRHFKKAVDRNRIKRMLRETYRLNKSDLHLQFQSKTSQLCFFLVYVDKSLPNFEELQDKVISALNILKEKTRHIP